MEPQENDVRSMQEFLGMSVTEATAFLKRYVNLEAAMNAWIDSGGNLPPEVEPTKWDESLWSADRNQEYGPMNKPNAGSFNIESSDTLNPGVFSSAPTRPSSRTSNYISNTPKEGGDAMAMSHHSAGQEMGVTTTGGTYFGPATQSHHDARDWSLTVIPNRDTYANPDPEDRRRTPGIPVIMKPMSDGDSLPALIAILQAIPMAREALLVREALARDYGQSSDWWDGNPIRMARVVHVEYPNEDTSWQDMIHETQRVMSFMEQTDRAYGNAYNLVPAPGVCEIGTTKQGEFLRQWQSAVTKAAPGFELANIFKTTAHNDPAVVEPGEDQSTTIFEVRVDISERGNMLGSSLYEHLDEMLWSVDMEGGEPRNIYMEPGEILVFQAESRNRDEPGLGIDIPAELYSDRYLQEKMETTKRMRKERMKKFALARQANDRQHRLQTIEHPKTGKLVDAGELLEFAGDYFVDNSEKLGKIVPQSRNDMLVDVSDESKMFKYGDIALELKDVVERVTQTLAVLEESKKEAFKELRQLSDLFKHPSADPELNPTHRYTLRGVSTSQNTTYILSNPNAADDLIYTQPNWIWWKLTYDTKATEPVKHEQVTESDVLLAAKHDSRNVLLVYASDKAVAYPYRALPPQLKNFVRADNLVFERELQQHMSSAASNHVEMDDQDLEERRQLIDQDYEDFNADAEGEEVPLQINLDGHEGHDSDPPPYEDTVRVPGNGSGGGSSRSDPLGKGEMEGMHYGGWNKVQEWNPSGN